MLYEFRFKSRKFRFLCLGGKMMGIVCCFVGFYGWGGIVYGYFLSLYKSVIKGWLFYFFFLEVFFKRKNLDKVNEILRNLYVCVKLVFFIVLKNYYF